MKLVEQYIIQPHHPSYKEIDLLCFYSKNLYNVANYIIRQDFIKNNHWTRYHQLASALRENTDYCSLPRKVSQQILMSLDKNWKSFFKASASWEKNPSKFLGKPHLPHYKNKISGRNVLIYTNQAISIKQIDSGLVGLSQTNIRVHTSRKNINQIRIIPKNKQYVIEVIYERETEKQKECNGRFLSIDLGVNNICAVTSNQAGFQPRLISGGALKSINQYYNKQKAKYQSELPKEKLTSNKIVRLTNKRGLKIKHHLHNISKYIVDLALDNEINTIAVGKNDNWKQDVNIGKKNNQNFVQIPHSRLINMIKYKCELNGINFQLQEESYTSKCSFLDMEKIKKQKEYKGRRIKRGLFKSENGNIISADLNGSANILRKAFGDSVFAENSIEAVVVRPAKVKFCENRNISYSL